MRRGIGKRVRAQAALICAIAASGGVRMFHAGLRRSVWSRAYYDIARRLGVSTETEAYALAVAAWGYAKTGYPECPWHTHADADAEALLRTGWAP